MQIEIWCGNMENGYLEASERDGKVLLKLILEK